MKLDLQIRNLTNNKYLVNAAGFTAILKHGKYFCGRTSNYIAKACNLGETQCPDCSHLDHTAKRYENLFGNV